MFAPFPSTFVATRTGVHSLAEHVLCAVRHQAIGRIGLIPVVDGIGCAAFGEHNRVVALIGDELVDRDDRRERRELVSTLRSAARFFDVTPGVPGDLWHPTTAIDLDETLSLDPSALDAIYGWLGFAADVHRSFSATVRAVEIPEPTLWPEHLDLAVSVSGANYGASLGDESSVEPYLYVGPHDRPFPKAPIGFWNQPYGASLAASAVESIDTAVAFLVAGYQLVVDDASVVDDPVAGDTPISE